MSLINDLKSQTMSMSNKSNPSTFSKRKFWNCWLIMNKNEFLKMKSSTECLIMGKRWEMATIDSTMEISFMGSLRMILFKDSDWWFSRTTQKYLLIEEIFIRMSLKDQESFGFEVERWLRRNLSKTTSNKHNKTERYFIQTENFTLENSSTIHDTVEKESCSKRIFQYSKALGPMISNKVRETPSSQMDHP